MQKFIIQAIDFIRGNQIKKSVHDIKVINNEQDIDKIKAYHKERLEILLNTAKQHTDFYSGYGTVEDFSNFPVINKNTINANRASFLNKKYQTDKLRKVTTSGSTGVPFLVYHNPEKTRRQLADNYYFSEACGHFLGQKLYYIRIWNEINDLGRIQRLLKNIVQVNTSTVDHNMVQQLLRDLHQQSGKKSILAYSSSLEAMVHVMRTEKIEVPKIEHLSCIITMAEALNETAKKRLEEALNTKVFSRYSNSENGFFAHQIPYLGNNYKINNASFKIEILDFDSNAEVPNGKPGRIVITDLFNFALPMVRYDTGDIGVMEWVKDEKGANHLVLSKIEGRRLDFISFEGKLISPHTVDYALRTFDQLKQFQLILKKDNTFELLLNTDQELSEQQGEEMKQRLKAYIGEKADITITRVDAIPLLSSGKRKIVKTEE